MMTKRLVRAVLMAAGLAGLAAGPTPAHAVETVVQIGGGFGGGRAILNRPAGRPSVGFVLLPGGDGGIGVGDDGSLQSQRGIWLTTTRGAYVRSGMASLLIDRGTSVAEAVRYMRTIAPRVILVAMSRGATRVPDGLGERPDGVVLVSATLNELRQAVGDAGRLPRMLVIHHRQDSCRATLASDVEPFIAWTGGRARAIWFTGGPNEGNPCRGRSYHGLVGRGGQIVGHITSFARGR